MPTPVSTARQCLTDGAARALDDAVAVARRRCHAQTTSLHAVSALLSLPSSSLRDAITRARTAVPATAAISPGLQLRALELSVGVSLDRLPSAKPSSSNSTSSNSTSSAAAADDDGPPVSNSLMAAIKRSQANQRRHPDTFHLMQIHNSTNQIQNPQFNQGTASFLKVELKHFVLSILDDPIVSRVLGEAGFRSPDIKLALLQPPQPSPSRFFQTRAARCPPLFLCNRDPVRTGPGPGTGCGFPFVDENCRRVAEVLKSKRNPLLIGVYAKNALRSFVEVVEKGGGSGLLAEMGLMRVVCLEKEVKGFLGGSVSEEKMGLRFEEVGREVGGGGVVVSFGEVEVFVGDGVGNVGAVGFVVSRLTRLLLECGGGCGSGGKVWLIGVAETCDAYSKFLGLFPNVEKDWDLHPLTVTSATPSMEGLYPKSSLMGSFVPFGGFFSTPSEITSPVSCTNAPFTRCDKCNEKCEEEVADNLKVGSATLASTYSTGLPWLQKVNVDTHRGLNLAKVNEESTSMNDKILGFQKKWSDICRNLHHTRSSLPELDISQTRPRAPLLEGLRFGSGFKESSSKDPSLSKLQYSTQISYMPKELHSIFPTKQLPPVPLSSDAVSVNTGTDHVPIVSESQQTDMRTPWVTSSSMARMSVPDHKSSSSIAPVTTDLGLGTLYAAQEPDTPKRQDHKKHLPHLSESLSTDFDSANDNTSHQTPRSSSFSYPCLEGKFDSVDVKSLNKHLTEMVGWQDEAICAINRSLSTCKSGAQKQRGSHVRADIWFAFLGPDRIGKRKIASALAEIIFRNKECLISVDLSSEDRFYPNSIFEGQKSYCHDVLQRKTVVDYIAGELSKKPHSVVFLENVDKADYLVHTNLLQAISTGKFPDSHGREISISNAIFIVASTVCKGNGSSVSEGSEMFSEEKILEARKCQMQLFLGHTSEDAIKSGSTNVKVVPRKGFSKPPFLNKRKQVDSSNSREGGACKMQKQAKEASRSYLDLNMPIEEVGGGINDNNDLESESTVENSQACLSDLCNQIDEKVVFKPFDFDALAEQVLKSISTQFQRTFYSEFQLEIDYEVMVQILAAAWLSDKKNAVEDWIELVLGRGFVEAKQKYHPSAQHVMKLVNCESNFVQEHAPGVCLPPRINLN